MVYNGFINGKLIYKWDVNRIFTNKNRGFTNNNRLIIIGCNGYSCGKHNVIFTTHDWEW
jgi:hypothetical protein